MYPKSESNANTNRKYRTVPTSNRHYSVMILIFHESRPRENSLTMSSECAEQAQECIRKANLGLQVAYHFRRD